MSRGSHEVRFGSSEKSPEVFIQRRKEERWPKRKKRQNTYSFSPVAKNNPMGFGSSKLCLAPVRESLVWN